MDKKEKEQKVETEEILSNFSNDEKDELFDMQNIFTDLNTKESIVKNDGKKNKETDTKNILEKEFPARKKNEFEISEENEDEDKLEFSKDEMDIIFEGIRKDYEKEREEKLYKEIYGEENNIKILIPNNSNTTTKMEINREMISNKKVCVVLDNKSLLYNCFEEFNDKKYNIKILDFQTFKGNHYNPFIYFRNEMEIINYFNVFVDNIINSNDEKIYCVMKSFLIANALYLFKYRPKEEQNLESMSKLANAFEINYRSLYMKSPLDRIFDEVIKHNPNDWTTITHYYAFKNASFHTLSDAVAICTNYLSQYRINQINKFIVKDNVRLDYMNNTILFVIKPNIKMHEPLYKTFLYQLEYLYPNKKYEASFKDVDNVEKYIENLETQTNGAKLDDLLKK